MKKNIDLNDIQKEREILDCMIEDAIRQGIRISRDEAILKQSQKLNRLISKYQKAKTEL